MLSDARPLEDGVLQGNIFPFTLYAMTTNSVIYLLPDGIRGSFYVDDLSIYISPLKVLFVERKLQLLLYDM